VASTSTTHHQSINERKDRVALQYTRYSSPNRGSTLIKIYTDGSCLGNPGPGGWAAIVVDSGTERTLRGRTEQTTNNRMEVQAVIRGLESIDGPEDVTVLSDSQYVVNTMTKGWKRKANLDLWDLLDLEADKRTINWCWVKAHAGNPLNEKVDAIANQEARLAGSNPSEETFSHTDESGNATMVDIGSKSISQRIAVAKGSVIMSSKALQMVRTNSLAKGDVLGVARVAGIMAAKNTSQLIPLCHSISLDNVLIEFHIDECKNAINIKGTASTMAKTGVEMEALTAVSVAALTIYDMAKSVDKTITIGHLRLAKKLGGKSGDILIGNNGE